MFAVLALAAPLSAQVPQLINYQGRVAVNGVNFTGAGQFAFALVDTTGATTYWSNDGTSAAGSQPTTAVSLTVTNGLYSVLLGDATLLNMTVVPATVFTHPDVRLRVWFNDGVHGAQLLTPGQRIAAVGYAMVAGTATTTTNFTGSLAGDVTGTQGATVVGAVGGTTAANVAAGANLANAATDANTASTIVKRDTSGNFSAGTITGTFSGDGSALTNLPATGGGLTAYAHFFLLSPPDALATVAPGTDVPFPQDGPGSGITRSSATTFTLPSIGVYEVTWQVSISEAGQLILTLNGADLAYTVVGRATGTSQITGDVLIQTTVINSVLTVRNPAGEGTALTVTPLAGGVRPVSGSLVIKQIH